MGRPSLYTPELADEICERLAGGEGLNTICRDDHMPAESTVRGWAIEDHEGFFARYARAREMQADHFADDVVGIADGVRGSIESAEVQAAKLAIDTRKWAAAKAAPKKYGDKLDIENRTTLNTADPLTALLQQIAESGAKVHDPRPSEPG